MRFHAKVVRIITGESESYRDGHPICSRSHAVGIRSEIANRTLDLSVSEKSLAAPELTVVLVSNLVTMMLASRDLRSRMASGSWLHPRSVLGDRHDVRQRCRAMATLPAPFS